MSAKPPAVPRENTSPKGPGGNPADKPSELPDEARLENHQQQGRPANTKQNTRHPGSRGSRGR